LGWWHNLTHAHIHAEKPHVGAILLCRRRLGGGMRVNVATDGAQVHNLPGSPETVARLVACDSADDLRRVAGEIGAGRDAR
jgi:hypothetical protein